MGSLTNTRLKMVIDSMIEGDWEKIDKKYVKVGGKRSFIEYVALGKPQRTLLNNLMHDAEKGPMHEDR